MKSVFRKLRGKKKNEGDVERGVLRTEGTHAQSQSVLTTPVPSRDKNPVPVSIQNQEQGKETDHGQNPDHARDNDQDHHQKQSQSQVRESSQVHESNHDHVAESSTATQKPVKFNFISSVPADQITRMLAEPASSATEDVSQVLKVEVASVCSVCYNFNPYKAPRANDGLRQSWAREEYQISDDTTDALITVKNSKTLIGSAKQGCIYCNIVKWILESAQAGWEGEESFITIYLAVGLPVIVRLDFDITWTVPFGAEEMRQFGYELADGQVMNFVVTVSRSEKKPIELEIYRPIITDGQLTRGQVAMSSLVSNMGFAEEISPHAGDKACFDFIKRHVDFCVKNHKCGKDGSMPLLPDRVLWIEADVPGGIRLLEPKNIRAPFIALSYCWGPVSADTYLTNASNLSERKAGINLHDLPPLFRDVIEAAQVLGIEYIWIDRLCILQGSDEDFHSQASKMAEIYGYATLTIAAASAVTENDKILISRDKKHMSVDMSLDVKQITSLELRYRHLSHLLGTEKAGGDYGKVSKRAWIWQERLLAARTVFFTPGALKFECRCHSYWEGSAKDCTGYSWSARMDEITHETWTGLVEEYMGREITRASDRLPAMDAVMKRIGKITGWQPFWGLWTNTLIESLAWEAEDQRLSGRHSCQMNPGYYAPSWSWASIDGPIEYGAGRSVGVQAETDPMDWDLQCRSLDGSSGLIRFSGCVITIEMHCTLEIETTIDDEGNEIEAVDSNNKPKLLYRYEVKGPTDTEGFKVSADVALKPWDGDSEEKSLSNVVRMPYGEKPPQQPWSASCACLLLGKRKASAIVLVLGRSLRRPGYWERVGTVCSLPPERFLGIPKRNIDMV